MDKEKKLHIYIVPILLIALLTAIDQLSKHIVEQKFKLYETKPIINDIFHLTYIRNEGMAWGMLQGKRIFFLVITVIILGFCLYIYNKTLNNNKFKVIRGILIILISGAIGNMIDRFKLGYVIDFFDFRLINFPIFNIADIYVVVSMFLLAILILFKYNNDDIEELFGHHNDDSMDDNINTENTTNESSESNIEE